MDFNESSQEQKSRFWPCICLWWAIWQGHHLICLNLANCPSVEWKVNLWNKKKIYKQRLIKRDGQEQSLQRMWRRVVRENAEGLTCTRSKTRCAPSGWLPSARSTAWSGCPSSDWSPPSSKMALVSPCTLHTWGVRHRLSEWDKWACSWTQVVFSQYYIHTRGPKFLDTTP